MDSVNEQFGFKLRTNMKFGAGISSCAGKMLNELGYANIGIILDHGITKLDATKKLTRSLEGAGIVFEIFENDRAEPDYDFLESFKKNFSGRGFDAILGAGGGSTIDLAKGVATLVTNPGEAILYRGFPKLKCAPLPVIAIPTTAGTGSEATYNAVFTDLKEKKKLGINSELNFPALAVLDPLFTLSCPERIVISAGMDALTHTLESFAHKGHTQLSRMYSKKAFSLIFNNLMVVLEKPENINVRGALQLGSYLAGIALINSGSGPSGALSYPLGVHYKIPHGMAGAVFLSSIAEFNVSKGYADYAELYDLAGLQPAGKSGGEKSALFVKALKALDRKMKIPSLTELGLGEKDVRFMIDQYDVLKNAIAQNPIPVSKEDLKSIIEKTA